MGYGLAFLMTISAACSLVATYNLAVNIYKDQTKERQEQNIEAHCSSVSAQDPSITVSEASILKQACIDDLINAEKIINNMR